MSAACQGMYMSFNSVSNKLESVGIGMLDEKTICAKGQREFCYAS